MSFLPEPVRMILGAHRLTDFSDHGPLMFAVRQKLTGYPDPPPAACLSGRTVFVTGATAGVGLKAAEKILQLGARLVLAARNMEKAEKTRRGFLAKVPDGRVLLYELDMDSLGSVDGFVEKLRADEIGRIDIALLNAGVILNDRRRVDGGWSQMMQINFRSTAYLALLLIPFLTHVAPGAPTDTAARAPGRLILVASEAHAFSGYEPPASGDILSQFHSDYNLEMNCTQEYFTSKLFIVLFTRELAARVDPAILEVLTVTPGFCASGIFPDAANLATRFIYLLHARSVEQGARLEVHAVTSFEPGLSGKYLRDGRVTR